MNNIQICYSTSSNYGQLDSSLLSNYMYVPDSSTLKNYIQVLWVFTFKYVPVLRVITVNNIQVHWVSSRSRR